MAAPETFGWARHNEDPEAYWRQAARRTAEDTEARLEAYAARAVPNELKHLRKQGLLREDRLSYTRICQLEHETEIVTGTWREYLEQLREAQRKDEERYL